MIKNFSALLFFIVLFSASSAFASKTVTGPTVKDGESFAESKSEYVIDDDSDEDGAWKEKINVGHGFTSYWASEIEATIERGGASEDDTEFRSVEWKNKFQFTDQKTAGFDTGMRIGYVFDTSGDSPDEIDVRFLAGKDIGAYAHRANLIFDRQVGGGAEDDINTGFAWSSRYKYADSFQPGFELYNSFGEMGDGSDFDEQDHRAGPVFYGRFDNGLSYDVGYLFGISDNSPDGTVKAIVRYAW